MRGVVDGAEALARQVCVDLRGGQVGMPEQFLDGAEVGAPLEQVGGVRVAEHVRVEGPAVGQRVA
jgi:hypothetical protein